uniref:Uncharacterized protein n=1 Tax=Melopsittacus undulatus TaxID=13146 RepID=A0A8V5G4A7_MELUD
SAPPLLPWSPGPITSSAGASPCRQLGAEGISAFIKQRQRCLWGAWLCGSLGMDVLMLSLGEVESAWKLALEPSRHRWRC